MTDDPPELRPGGSMRTVEAGDVDEERFLETLQDVISILDDAGIDHVLMGGLAVAVLARPRWTHDIDLFLRPDDARRALDILDEAGFDTERTDPMWLFKAVRDDVLVDIIFRSVGGYYLDDSILERALDAEFKGVAVRVIPPEDLLVIKASAHVEDSPYHWFDALALLARRSLDWDYLIERSRRAVRRVLSLLVYAESADIAVPRSVIDALATFEQGGNELARPETEVSSSPGSTSDAELESMRGALRAHPKVGQLDIDLCREDGGFRLEGTVASAHHRDDIEAAARELFPGADVRSRLAVDQADGAPRVERLA